jgi:hypothetical protein
MQRPPAISLLFRCLEDYQVLAPGLGLVELQLPSDLYKLALLLQHPQSQEFLRRNGV